MIRPFTLVFAGVAAVAGLYLYHVKHQTQLLERTITRTQQSIDAARERSGVLRAEWTLMNDPDRLAELAGQFLKLVTVAPRQFTTVADLASRLPAPRALPVAPEQSTDAPAPDDPAGGEQAEPTAEAPLPLPPPPAPPVPQRVATPASTPPSASASATASVSARPAAPPAVSPASPGASVPAAVVAAPALAAARASAVASPATTSPRPPAPVVAQRAAPPPTSSASPAVAVAPPGNVAGGGSALGMARGIVAPPVPVGGDIHLTRGN